MNEFLLRPSVINDDRWNPERPSKKDWAALKKQVLERDNYSCWGCRHHAIKYMHVHHLAESADSSISNLATICVACHAVLHIGRSLSEGAIEIWQSPLSQKEIVIRTREGVRGGRTLSEIKSDFKLESGPLPPDSVDYANNLLDSMGSDVRGYLPEPLCAVFVKFSRWQLET